MDDVDSSPNEPLVADVPLHSTSEVVAGGALALGLAAALAALALVVLAPMASEWARAIARAPSEELVDLEVPGGRPVAACVDARSCEPVAEDAGALACSERPAIEPLQEELLAEPIELPSCPGVHIVEWRTDPRKPQLGPTPENLAVLDSGCRKAMYRFREFVRVARIRVRAADRPFELPVSVVPQDDAPRNLNDTRIRFRQRAGEAPHRPARIWGFCRHRPLYVILTVDGPAETTMAHEVFHAMSIHYGALALDTGPWTARAARDEQRARAFTEMLGLGR